MKKVVVLWSVLGITSCFDSNLFAACQSSGAVGYEEAQESTPTRTVKSKTCNSDSESKKEDCAEAAVEASSFFQRIGRFLGWW